MKSILFIFTFILISCNSSKKEDTKKDSFDSEKVVDAANDLVNNVVEGSYPAKNTVREKAVEEDTTIKKLPAKDTLNDLSRFLHKTFKNDTIISWKTGDITNDTIEDFVIVVQDKEGIIEDEEYPDVYYTRKVVLLETIEEYPNFKLRGVNESLVECSNCGGAGVGDPFQGISIKNNYFSIEELYGACTKSFVVTTFKYDESLDNWLLHKIGQEHYSCNREPDPDGSIRVDHEEETKKDFGDITFAAFGTTSK